VVTNGMSAEAIQDAFEHPVHRGMLATCDYDCTRENVFCGDSIRVQTRVEGGALREAAFDGRGCVLSQASAELLLQDCVGRQVDVVKSLTPETVLARLGLSQITPARRKCVVLSLDALHCALG